MKTGKCIVLVGMRVAFEISDCDAAVYICVRCLVDPSFAEWVVRIPISLKPKKNP